MGFLKDLFFGKDPQPDYKDKTITVQAESDGTLDIGAHAHTAAHLLNIAELPATERSAIEEYRKLAMTADVDEAIQEIVNESFNIDQRTQAITLDWADETTISKSTQNKIADAYHYVYHHLFDFDNNGAYIFRRFYVDGRLFIHKVVNKDSKTISSLRFIDSLQIRRIRNSFQDNNGLVDLSKEELFYMFTPKAADIGSLWGAKAYKLPPEKALRFPKQAIAYTDSGLVHHADGYVVGWLSKAIVPYNNMKMMEDAMVIYRVVRSPSRRVFYVDVGDMPKAKGEQYMKDMMTQFRNKMTYDANSGVLTDRRHILSMLEDIWLPRRTDGRSTEISTLDEGSNLGVTEDVEYCRDKFYRSLNVPRSRFGQEQTPFSTTRLTEITRDEYRFLKFIQSVRNRFIKVIEDVLKTELILRGIIKESEWHDVVSDIKWGFSEDNQLTELKQSEILQNKLNTLQQVDSLVERYFSIEWAMQNVMDFTTADIENIKKQRKLEQSEGDMSDENKPQGFEDHD